MPSVTLFRDFAEDGRTSMEIYADNLSAELRVAGAGRYALNEYRPRLNGFAARLPERSNLRMRAARYLAYPRMAAVRQGNINHILDHGYAHLMSVLDPARTVLTVHDLIPILAGRGLIHGIRRNRRSWLAEWTAGYYAKAARIIAISENTKRDLVKHCGCDPKRIEVVYYGLNPAFRPFAEEERKRSRARFGLAENARVVLITGQEFYKNHETCLKVMERLHGKYGNALRLLRLGRITPEWRESSRGSPFREQIIEIPSLPPERMPDLYNAVDCLLFPSWYEGFGLPPLEAMACGTPAATSDVASLPEAVGTAALTAAPDDIEAFSMGVTRLLEDDGFRLEMIAKGIAYSARFNWRENAQRTLTAYSQLAQQAI